MWEPTVTWTHSPTLLVLYALAVYRLTRLVTADVILERPRDWLVTRGGLWAVFITCPWCVSIWLAGGWILLAAFAAPIAWVAGALLAFSAVAGLLAGRE